MQKTKSTQNLAFVVFTGGIIGGTFPLASIVSSNGLDGSLVRLIAVSFVIDEEREENSRNQFLSSTNLGIVCGYRI